MYCGLSWEENYTLNGNQLILKGGSGLFLTPVLKTIATMPSQTRNFLIFLSIDTRQYKLSNYLLKIGGRRPLKGRYDVICNDVIFH